MIFTNYKDNVYHVQYELSATGYYLAKAFGVDKSVSFDNWTETWDHSKWPFVE